MQLKPLIRKIETDLPGGTKQLRSMDTGQLQGILTRLLRMAGLSETDISTFITMEPGKALELLKSVMRHK